MVSNLSLCLVGMLLCQSDTMSEDITQQKHYSELEKTEVETLFEDIVNPSYSRELPNLETLEYMQGYYDYIEEQKRIEEEQKQYQEWLDSFDRRNYRQTVYTIEQGERTLGSGLYYGHPNVKNINNIMHYNDEEYGWIPIYAINMNEVVSSGQDEKGIWNIYGSIIEFKQDDEVWYGFLGDACGACRYEPKVDLWTHTLDYDLDMSNIDWRIVRYGYEE